MSDDKVVRCEGVVDSLRNVRLHIRLGAGSPFKRGERVVVCPAEHYDALISREAVREAIRRAVVHGYLAAVSDAVAFGHSPKASAEQQADIYLASLGMEKET